MGRLEASTHTADLILEGSFQQTNVDDIAQDLICHMKRRTILDKILGLLTQDE